MSVSNPEIKVPDDAALHVRHCPACGSASFSVVGTLVLGFPANEGHRTPELRQPDYEVLLCQQCALYFKSTRMIDADLSHYYAELPFEQFETDFLMRTDRAVVAALTTLPETARILDYGCGVGRILLAAGRLQHSYGVEVNTRSSEIASSRGIKIVTEKDLAVDMRESFDAIIMSDVYEHLLEPMNTLSLLAGCLKPGGKFIIVTGNADAFPPGRRMGEFWYFRLPGHLQVLGTSHVAWFASRLGLQVMSIDRMSHYDVSFASRLAQNLRAWAYERFHAPGHSISKALLRLVPIVNRAVGWSAAPGITYRPDHVLIVLKKP
jgi:SAM-dependent methyltransferase